jgi:hypothetical protein
MRTFSFLTLIKQSFRWAWHFKRMWIIAFFVATTSLSFQFSSDNWQGIANFFKTGFSEYRFDILIPLGLLFFVVIYLLSLVAKAGILVGLKKLKQKEDYRVLELFKFGIRKIPKTFLLEIYFGVINLVLTTVFVLYVAFSESFILQILYMLALLLFLIYNLLVYIIKHFAYCLIVFDEKSPWQAIKLSLKLFRNNIKQVLLAKLLEIVLILAFMLAISATIFIISVPAVMIMTLSFLFGGFIIFIILIGFVAALAALFAVLCVKGFISTVTQSFMTQVYWELESKK